MSQPSLHYLSDRDHTGYGVAARRLLLGLHAIGCQIAWTPITWNLTNPLEIEGDRDVIGLSHLERGDLVADVMVVHATPELVAPLEHLRPRGTPLVLHTVWEHVTLQPHWPELINRCDAVVVPTRWNADAFAAAGVTVPIVVVPHAHAHDEPSDSTWIDPIAPDDSHIVHSIARWGRRKDPGRAVEAYCRAFDDNDDTHLILKTSYLVDGDVTPTAGPEARRYQTSWSVAAILARNAPAPDLHLVTAPLTHAQVAGLHQRSSCWISLPHSEGWDLGCFDAAVAGCPVITTGYGAPLEYLDPECSYLIPGAEMPHHYLPETTWIEADIDAAVEALRAIHADPAEALKRARRQAGMLHSRYAPRVVAAQFVDGLRSAHII